MVLYGMKLVKTNHGHKFSMQFLQGFCKGFY